MLDMPKASNASNSDRAHQLLTIGDAVDFCRELIDEQINKAGAVNAPPNEPIDGDTISRTTFFSILNTDTQRSLFLSFIKEPRIWPRASCIFGAPPYYFLRQGDGDALSALGFSKGHRRTNMAFDDSTTPSVVHFGVQYVDEHQRDYRIGILDRLPLDMPLPGRGFFDEFLNSTIMFNVKVRKRSAKERTRLLRSIDKERVMFPRGGQLIKLSMPQAMRRLIGITTDGRETSLTIKIISIAARSSGSNTAALTARIVE